VIIIYQHIRPIQATTRSYTNATITLTTEPLPPTITPPQEAKRAGHNYTTMSASPVNNGAAAAGAPTSVNEARDPSGFLSEIIGAPVTVKLNSGVVYRGVFLNLCFPCDPCSLRRKEKR